MAIIFKIKKLMFCNFRILRIFDECFEMSKVLVYDLILNLK